MKSPKVALFRDKSNQYLKDCKKKRGFFGSLAKEM